MMSRLKRFGIAAVALAFVGSLAWASALGAVAITFGVLLAAAHANEWMKQIVIVHATPAGNQVAQPECPEDELIEEGLSLAECYEDEELNILYSDIHLWTCWALLAAVAVHLSGALYHAFRNDGIARTISSRPASG